eukprot:CAMPEP_0119271622 /NCGR_PEP_ID=MMETSP1329-20130426/8142_1 /TAXON_ID=114041 /ORGANISM="Genus nov. species nov., Strain RCC1024" /LENGTH=56 /DNA_ID=CAMNT_0007271673 /DNA_START=29 /DNA_END=199 /DNA_ORIENTATION=+
MRMFGTKHAKDQRRNLRVHVARIADFALASERVNQAHGGFKSHRVCFAFDASTTGP